MRTLCKVFIVWWLRERSALHTPRPLAPQWHSLEQEHLETRQEEVRMKSGGHGLGVGSAALSCGWWVTSWLLGMQDAFCCLFSLFGNKLVAFENEKPKLPLCKMTSCTSDWWPLVCGCLNNACFSTCFHFRRAGPMGLAAELVGVFITFQVPGIGEGAPSRSSGSIWWMNKWRHTPRSRFCSHADTDPGWLGSVPGEAHGPVSGKSESELPEIAVSCLGREGLQAEGEW